MAHGGHWVPGTLPLSVRLKLGLCHLRVPDASTYAPAILEPAIHDVAEPSAEHEADGFKIVEGYMGVSNYTEAWRWLRLLGRVPRFQKPFLHIKQAQCLLKLAQAQAAVDKALLVVSDIPDQVDAIEVLARGYHMLGQQGEAMKWGLQLPALPDVLLLASHTRASLATVTQAQPARTKAAAVTVRGTDARSRGRPGPLAPSSRPSTLLATAVPAVPASADTVRRADLSADYNRFVSLCEADLRAAAALGVKLCAHYLHPVKIRVRDKSREATGGASLPLPGEAALQHHRGRPWAGATIYGSTQTPISIFDQGLLDGEEWVLVLVRTCEALLQHQRYADAAAIAHRAAVQHDGKKLVFNWLEVLGLEGAGYLEDAFKLIKTACSQNTQSLRLWNKLYRIYTQLGIAAQKTQRFFVRLLSKDDSFLIHMAAGNHHLMAGSQSWAAGCYIRAAHLRPSDPLICFSVGVAYLRMVMQRRVADRNLCAVQALAFLWKYFELKGGWGSVEACFNLARAHHQLGLAQLATQFYQAALRLPPRRRRPPVQGCVQPLAGIPCERIRVSRP